MKILIWLLVFFFCYGLPVTILKNNGVQLGFIPTFILILIDGFIATCIVKKWNSYIEEKRNEKAEQVPLYRSLRTTSNTKTNNILNEKDKEK